MLITSGHGAAPTLTHFWVFVWIVLTILYWRPVHREPIHSSWDPSKADANWCRWQLWQSWLVCSLRAEGLYLGAKVEAQLGVDLQRKRGQGAAERSHRPLRQVPPLEIHYSGRHADICPFVMTPAPPSLWCWVGSCVFSQSRQNQEFILLVLLVDMCCQSGTTGGQCFYTGPPFTRLSGL